MKTKYFPSLTSFIRTKFDVFLGGNSYILKCMMASISVLAKKKTHLKNVQAKLTASPLNPETSSLKVRIDRQSGRQMSWQLYSPNDMLLGLWKPSLQDLEAQQRI
jgi:hypothetical protein